MQIEKGVKKMLPKEKIFELMKEAGLDEQKFYQLLLKADPSFVGVWETAIAKTAPGVFFCLC